MLPAVLALLVRLVAASGEARNITDSAGRQVPWRRLPDPAPRASKEVELLNAGVQDGAFVGLLDLGPTRAVRNRADLVMANERDFVGRVTVFGSDDRRRFTRLSTTKVFDLRGATAATSTTTEPG